jgi:hypothetical protein
LNNQAFSEQEKKIRDEQMRIKLEKDLLEKAKIDQAKKMYDQSKEKDFEDLLSGKKQKEAEKSLGDVFKEYYSKAKTINTQEYINSAKSSINSFSSILEKRRQAHHQK